MLTAILLAGSVLAGAAAPATAAPVDDGWLPWLGCWRLVDDEVREPLQGDSTALGEEPLPKSGLVCVAPSAEGSGVTVTTSDGAEVSFEETLVANGEKRPSSKGECTGWQQTSFSANGHRLFTRAELTCQEGRKLSVSGLSLIVAPSNWVEIQVVDGEGARGVVVRRYRPAGSASDGEEPLLSSELAARARRARYDAAEVLSVDDVIEVVRKAEPEVAEAAVLEMKDEGFDLDARKLVRLDEAGARSGLIDLMVALSYPDYFLVDREPEPGMGYGNTLPGPYGGWGGPTGAIAYPYYFAPFGAYYWYAPYQPVYVLRPSGPSSYEVGRVVKGRGYTRVTRQTPSTGFWGSSSGGSRGGGSSSSGGSGGTAEPGGYSSGGGGGTRHAKPRPK